MPLPPQVSHSFRDREQEDLPTTTSVEHPTSPYPAVHSVPRDCHDPTQPSPLWTGRK